MTIALALVAVFGGSSLVFAALVAVAPEMDDSGRLVKIASQNKQEVTAPVGVVWC